VDYLLLKSYAKSLKWPWNICFNNMGLFEFKQKKKTLDFSDSPPKPSEGLPAPPPIDFPEFKPMDPPLPVPPMQPMPPMQPLAPMQQAVPTTPGLQPVQAVTQPMSVPKIPPSPPQRPELPGAEIPARPVQSDIKPRFTMEPLTPPPKQQLPTFSEQKNELPAFTMGVQGTPKSQPRPEIEVPAPPPNLRSEISPLELEKLEEKYLYRHPKISDIEQPYSHDRHRKLQKPLFVRTDLYRQALNNFIDIKDMLTESEETVFRLENLKKNADVEFSEFKKAIEEIQRKLIFIDKTLFEG